MVSSRKYSDIADLLVYSLVLADTETLHQKIAAMSDRIRQLEDALAILHSTAGGPTGDPHPLLHRDLLEVKFSMDLHSPSSASKEAPIQDGDEEYSTSSSARGSSKVPRAASDSPKSIAHIPSFANAHPSLVSELNVFHGNNRAQIQSAYQNGGNKEPREIQWQQYPQQELQRQQAEHEALVLQQQELQRRQAEHEALQKRQRQMEFDEDTWLTHSQPQMAYWKAR